MQCTTSLSLPSVCAFSVDRPNGLSDHEAAVAAVALYSTADEACVVLQTTPFQVEMVRLRRTNWAQVVSILREHQIKDLRLSVDPSLSKVHLCMNASPADEGLRVTTHWMSQLAA